MREWNTSVTFDDVLLKPRYSQVESRSEGNLSQNLDSNTILESNLYKYFSESIDLFKNLVH